MSRNIISFNKNTFYFKKPEGIGFKSNNGYFCVKMNDNSVNAVFSALNLLSKDITEEEFYNAIGVDLKDRLFPLVEVLKERKFLYYPNKQSYQSLNCNYRIFAIDSSGIGGAFIAQLEEYFEGIVYCNNIDELDQINGEAICIFFDKGINKELYEKMVERNPFAILAVTSISDNNYLYLISEENPIEEMYCLFAKDKEVHFELNQETLVLADVLYNEITKIIDENRETELKYKYFVHNKLQNKTIYKKRPNYSNSSSVSNYMKLFEVEEDGVIREFTRKDKKQIPLSLWTARFSTETGEVTEVTCFGDNHIEARNNAYSLLIEKHIGNYEYVENEREVVCLFEHLKESDINTKLVGCANLKKILKSYYSGEKIFNGNRLDIESYMYIDEINHYCKMINCLGGSLDQVEVQKDITGIFITRIMKERITIMNAGYSEEDSLINSLRLYVYVMQDKVEEIRAEDIGVAFFKKYTRYEDENNCTNEIRDVYSIFNHPDIVIKQVEIGV